MITYVSSNVMLNYYSSEEIIIEMQDWNDWKSCSWNLA